jgi:hypothetical protein
MLVADWIGKWSNCSAAAEDSVAPLSDQRGSVSQIPAPQTGKNISNHKSNNKTAVNRPESVHSLAFSLRTTASQISTRSRPILTVARSEQEQKLVIGYYSFPEDLAADKQPLMPQEIPAEKLTHLNYGELWCTVVIY